MENIGLLTFIIMKRKIRTRKDALICLVVLLSLLYSTPLLAKPSVGVSFKSKNIKQGDVLFINVKANPGIYKVSGTIFDRPVHFYSNPKKDKYNALVGIDMDTKPRQYTLSLVFEDQKGGKTKKDYKIKVGSTKFGTQKLTLPAEMVELDEETLEKVKLEEEKIGKIWDIFTEDHLWDGNFLEPVKGKTTGEFGLRRIINGEPKNSHRGMDIAAPEGAPVRVANNGRVVFIDDIFYSGKSLVIDHGLGLFTMYFHLSETMVVEGEVVKKGQIIAKVGKTGRATGPHLHWGVRLNGARINPAAIVKLKLE